MKNPEQTPDTIKKEDFSIVNNFDDTSMLKRITTLSPENLKAVDSALNNEDIINIEMCKNIMLGANSEQRAKIAEFLSDIRMTVEPKAKEKILIAFAKYMNSI